MKLKSPYIILLTLLCHPSWAEQSQKELDAARDWDENQLSAEKTIPSLLEGYGNSIGCAFSFNPKHLVKLENQGSIKFVAAITLDAGCSGGSAMQRMLLVTMQYGGYHKINVVAERSTPSQTPPDFPKHLEKLYMKNGEIMFSGFVPDWSKDALCCASQPVKGKIAFTDNHWRVYFH